MSKVTLRKDEVKELGEKLSIYNYVLSKTDKAEIIDEKYIFINNKPLFFYHEQKIVPSLKLILENKAALKKITVDMGAVRFVVGGADIMRPGILGMDDSIKKDDLVVVIDKNNRKPLAVGQALFDALEMKAMTSGKAVKNLHYVSDKFWTL